MGSASVDSINRWEKICVCNELVRLLFFFIISWTI
jgi:hypothetical protein